MKVATKESPLEVRTLSIHDEQSRDAFIAWLRGPHATRLQRYAAEERGIHPDVKELNVSYRSLDSSLDIAGGFLLSQGFPRFFQEKLRQLDPVYRAATVVQDSSGALPVPYADDSSNEGVFIRGEVSAEDPIPKEAQPSFGRAVLSDENFYSSGIIAVSYKLLSSTLAEQVVGSVLANRIARLRGRHHAVGEGIGGAPLGLFNAASSSVQSENAASISATDIYNLIAALDVAYRPRGSFLMHSATLDKLAKLIDGEGRQLLPIKRGPMPTLFDYPVLETDFAESTLAAGNRTILFADVSRFLVREVGPLKMYKYIELYAESNCVGLQAQLYSDAVLLDSSAAVVLIQKVS